MRKTLATTAALCAITAPAWAANSPDVPTSPDEIVRPADVQKTGGGDKAPNASSKTAQSGGGQQGAKANAAASSSATSQSKGTDQSVKPRKLTIKPGVTEVMAISQHHLNRIVTPYSQPAVKTTSDAKIDVKKHVVYVASKSSAPITVYIKPNDSEAQALSLALVPRDVPPAQIELELADDATATGGADTRQRGAAKRWETGQAYIQTIKELFAGLAQGQVPNGYGLSQITADTDHVECTSPKGADLEYQFDGVGQRLQGGQLFADVGRVVNQDNEKIVLDERWCHSDGVAAVAFWPRIVLRPGQKAEVYIARRRAPKPDQRKRPSLLNHTEQ